MIAARIERWERLENDGPDLVRDIQFHRKHRVRNGLLFRYHDGQHKLCVPRSCLERVIATYHDAPDAAHPGRDETAREILRKYYYPNISRRVGDYIRQCLTCRTVKKRQLQEKAPLRAHSPRKCFEIVSLDILGPYKAAKDSGNRYIILAEDVFSKWVEAIAVPRVDGLALAKFLEEQIVSRYGTPRRVISDHGGQFVSGQYTT